MRVQGGGGLSVGAPVGSSLRQPAFEIVAHTGPMSCRGSEPILLLNVRRKVNEHLHRMVVLQANAHVQDAGALRKLQDRISAPDARIDIRALLEQGGHDERVTTQGCVAQWRPSQVVSLQGTGKEVLVQELRESVLGWIDLV